MNLIRHFLSKTLASLGTEVAVANCRRELDRWEDEDRLVSALAARLASHPPASIASVMARSA